MTNQLQPIDKLRERKLALKSKQSMDGFRAQLPSDVDPDKFTAIVIRAITEDATILNADKASFFIACSRAAQDGLIPDKREGAFVVRSGKVAWQVMIGGIRKNLARAGFDIRAEVIHENDFFDQDLGDDPTITHKPPKLGEERGEVIGAYAIATHLSTGEKFREVMSIVQLSEVRSEATTQSVWSKWTDEMYRKTVARRLFKYLPVAGSNEDNERINRMIEHDNENFDMTSTKASEKASNVQAALRKEEVIEHETPWPADDDVEFEGQDVGL